MLQIFYYLCYLILLLASITILLCFFFLFLIVFKNFFTNPVVIQNVRLQLVLIIPTGAPTTVANDAIEIYQLLQIKQLMIYQNTQSNILTKIFAHQFSFSNLCNKIVFNFIDFVQSKLLIIRCIRTQIWIHVWFFMKIMLSGIAFSYF